MGQHPPAPRGHVQEELHECQQVVVVIRCSTQGAAQLPELRGAQRASSLASRGRAPPTLTSHQPTKQGGLESRGVDRWSSVGPAGGREHPGDLTGEAGGLGFDSGVHSTFSGHSRMFSRSWSRSCWRSVLGSRRSLVSRPARHSSSIRSRRFWSV